jgi:hypothetical protein
MKTWIVLILLLITGGVVRADSTYIYTGNSYLQDYPCLGVPYSTTMTVDFTVPGSLTSGTFTPTSFLYDDGANTLTSASNLESFQAVVNSSGQLLSLGISLFNGSIYENMNWTPAETTWCWGHGQNDIDFSVTSNVASAWAVTTATTAEPSSALLFLVGFFLFCLARSWRSRSWTHS